MSEPAAGLDPAIGLLEFESITAGIVAADAMAKSSPIASLYAGTIHPGRYLVLVGGDTAAVEVAMEAAGSHTVVDTLFLADVHSAVVASLTTGAANAAVDREALGIIETATTATAIIAADAGVKAADVTLPVLRFGDDLGGKAYCLFNGSVADVEAAVDAATAAVGAGHRLIASTVISQLHSEMADNLAADLRFVHHIRTSEVS